MLEAYERLIYDAMSGDHTLFTSAEGIESLWERSEPLLENPPPVRPYRPGLVGPERDPPAHRARRVAAAVRTGLAQLVGHGVGPRHALATTLTPGNSYPSPIS